MIKGVFFDLDGTITPIGKGCSASTISSIHEIENKKVQVGIVSGKPVFYLCGFARQLELNNPILIGENGGSFQLGIDLPPQKYGLLYNDEQVFAYLATLKNELKKKMPFDLYFQPNDIGCTCFFKNEEERVQLEGFIDEYCAQSICVEVYKHADSFDITPKGINKKSGIQKVLNEILLRPDEIITIGNGMNDYPMFELSEFSIAIGNHDKGVATHVVSTIDEALNVALKKINQENHL